MALLLVNWLCWRPIPSDTETLARRMAELEQQNQQLASLTTATVVAILGITTGAWKRAARDLLRETWMAFPNVVRGPTRPATSGGVRAFFVMGEMDELGAPHARAVLEEIEDEQRSHGDVVLFPRVRETHPPGEKMFAFFEMCAGMSALFCIKSDDDAYVHTVRLETNLRALLRQHAHEMIYAGNTLWSGYFPNRLSVCAWPAMGPASLYNEDWKRENCSARGAVGPFPFAVGTFEVLSMPLTRWVTTQPETQRFVQRARSFLPPVWIMGEDTALGMWVHTSPFPITALHWGWGKIHDLCSGCAFTQAQRNWNPLTATSVVVHIKYRLRCDGDEQSAACQAKRREGFAKSITQLHANVSRVCDAGCEEKVLPFEVQSLEDLCGRSARIGSIYSKCKSIATTSNSTKASPPPPPDALLDANASSTPSALISAADGLLDQVLQALERSGVHAVVRDTPAVLSRCGEILRIASNFASGYQWIAVCDHICKSVVCWAQPSAHPD
ncbi:hypothetical protein EMIHUDRAFT_248390 [Emiliania huxleyi CCMP1516]|uniref:Hexosyltransferase n=2 Tax=Emiliania huxleyi TaxID=2903 RepID=A0A0D3IGJ5_EMIH1|nr:hypothetical protein EMIHUDRAFT_248390 [Emiliania huxleyi CCMP1516]EOD10380.1 hypothetical protein EMIHUDRAFT_248390 [Emiliania huxleyi CCMP1516]|eukprot:XP_005762809.1 hypothetical protein EMIHUDRAFT_248390 [Emiliania huxleyi CCMP1516]